MSRTVQLAFVSDDTSSQNLHVRTFEPVAVKPGQPVTVHIDMSVDPDVDHTERAFFLLAGSYFGHGVSLAGLKTEWSIQDVVDAQMQNGIVFSTKISADATEYTGAPLELFSILQAVYTTSIGGTMTIQSPAITSRFVGARGHFS